MSKKQWVGSALLLVCSGIFSLWGFSLERGAESGALDFKIIYAGTQCLLQHHDPYDPHNLQNEFEEHGWNLRHDPIFVQGVVGFVYFPTALPFVVPFALLPWGPGHLIWMLFTATCLTVAAFLIWDLARTYSSGLSLFLICFLTINCQVVLASGNTAGIATSFCIISVWCFIRARLIPIGVVCLAVSLALKPHDAAPIWLFFLLAGGLYRKRALQSLLLTIVISLPTAYWVTRVAPHWPSEMRANLQLDSAPGGVIDPYFTALTNQSANEILDLQSTLSIFKNDPHFYNPVTYTICGVLLIIGLVGTLKTSAMDQDQVLIALSALVPIAMILTYHRAYDAKLLLLTIPACALLWARGGVFGRLAGILSVAAILATAEVPISILLMIAKKINASADSIGGKTLIALLRPTSMILLMMGIFYLWVFMRGGDGTASKEVI